MTSILGTEVKLLVEASAPAATHTIGVDEEQGQRRTDPKADNRHQQRSLPRPTHLKEFNSGPFQVVQSPSVLSNNTNERMTPCSRRLSALARFLAICALTSTAGRPGASAFAPPALSSLLPPYSSREIAGPAAAAAAVTTTTTTTTKPLSRSTGRARPLSAFRADDDFRAIDASDRDQKDAAESGGRDEGIGPSDPTAPGAAASPPSWLADLWGEGGSGAGALFRKPPPFIVEDSNLLFYDVALLLNLSLSISFWVVHRMSFVHVGTALSEGSLLCIVWILAGLYNGAFLRSAVDGHRGGGVGGGGGGADDDAPIDGLGDGGPKAAAVLGFNTFMWACNLRIVAALIQAVWDHRPVGTTDGEMLIPLEIAVGLVLMSSWRALHSYYTPRI
uniref:Uncharacterized protein n=1 Tax=Odontella aurita TaxID=265563 RepID=A0A7S4MZ87_9STRA